MKEILITGWYGTETLGDKAILAGLVNSIKQKFHKVKIYIQSENRHISEITNSQIDILNDLVIVDENNALKLSSKVDYLIFGGGPIMAIFPLAKIESYFVNASKSKTKTIIAGCGVGPLGANSLNNSILNILKHADSVIFRDMNSLVVAKSIGFNGEAYISECPSFSWLEAENQKSILLKNIANVEEFKVILGLRKPPLIQYGRKLKSQLRNEYEENFKRKIQKILTLLRNKYQNISILPIPMCTNSYGDDDRWFYRELLSEIRNDVINYKYLAEEFNPSEYFKEFKNADLSICMRYHSIIFSIAAGIKTICIDYTLGEGKVASIAKEFNLPVLNLLDLDENVFIQSFEDVYKKNKQNYNIKNTFNNLFQSALNE